eukprot:CAMPEP_0202958652 /NCGR_PEP_ID=MMETSP1396-20130829/2938_1 /ASSEMBLY_ACC=CAM_ASM_000872 /TAXON_ID= /ORGANISM="Pseudokeronopsis sp., Strain Brazil" /LENGTH=44 /DNA_ID= /DNA_START= /DNA_END= /DNA_ORIENTATION=
MRKEDLREIMGDELEEHDEEMQFSGVYRQTKEAKEGKKKKPADI